MKKIKHPCFGYKEVVEFESHKSKLQEKIEQLEERISILETKDILNKLENLKSGETLDLNLTNNLINNDVKPLTIKKDTKVNLNLNNKKIIVTEKDIDGFIVEENAELTINGNGLLETADNGLGFTFIVQGKLIINSGNFKSKKDSEGKANACVYVKNSGVAEIYGGRFETSDGDFVLNKKDSDRATSSILVMGGEFVEFDPSNNKSEGNNTNFVADGYKVEKFIENDKNIYRVVKA